MERAHVQVQVVGSTGETVQTIDALAGENLRKMLLRRHTALYDPKTRRFDVPSSTGDCGGEGICGTCLVKVIEGADLLSPMGNDEHLVTRGTPTWRAACRTVVGATNEPGTVRIQLQPWNAADPKLSP